MNNQQDKETPLVTGWDKLAEQFNTRWTTRMGSDYRDQYDHNKSIAQVIADGILQLSNITDGFVDRIDIQYVYEGYGLHFEIRQIDKNRINVYHDDGKDKILTEDACAQYTYNTEGVGLWLQQLGLRKAYCYPRTYGPNGYVLTIDL